MCGNHRHKSIQKNADIIGDFPLSTLYKYTLSATSPRIQCLLPILTSLRSI